MGRFMMKTAGGIIGMIAGIVGFFPALFIFIINGFDSEWASVLFPFLCIIFAAFATGLKSKIPGILLILSAALGTFFGERFVAFCMLMAIVGGIFTLYSTQKTDTATKPQQ